MSASIAIEELYDALDDQTRRILVDRRGTNPVLGRGAMVRRALLAADLVGLTVAFLAAQILIPAHPGRANSFGNVTEILLFVGSLPGWVIAAKLYRLYDQDEERTDHSTPDDLVRVFHLVTVCSWGLLALFYVTRLAHPGVPKLLTFWTLAILLVVTARATARALCRRSLRFLQNTVIVGAGETGQMLAQKLLRHPEYGLNLVGFVDSEPMERSQELEHLTLLGGLDDLLDLVELLDVERVIIAFTNDAHATLLETIDAVRPMGVQIDIVPRLFDNLGPNIGIHTIEGVPLIGLPSTRLSRSSLLIKRWTDLAIAGLGLLLLSPLLLAITIALKLDSPGPVLYRHTRVGRERRSFRLFKFRTMHLEACRGEDYGGASAEDQFDRLMDDVERRAEFETSFKLRDDPRVTRLGRFLRRTSLDELPQLLNVLLGDLSLVGPRALTEEELQRYYGAAATELLCTRPGITGYWQINGRSDLTYSDRVRLDMAYIGGWSLGLDFLILARTVRVILRRAGAM